MSMTQPHATNKTLSFQEHLDDLQNFVQQAAHQGTPLHVIDLALFRRLLALGHTALAALFTLLGSGDQGPTVTLSEGTTAQRLAELHSRPYVSIFGRFQLHRTVSGTREGQKIAFVPLDNRLQLPAAPFSYLLQDWDQVFCVEQAFAQASSNIARIFGLKQSVASLEQMNVDLATPTSPISARTAPSPQRRVKANWWSPVPMAREL